MSFAVGDKVVYNPYLPNLKLPKFRPWDHARIIKIDGDYLSLEFYNFGYSKLKIRKEAISYLPLAHFSQVLAHIETKAFLLKEQRFRNIYKYVLDELVKSTYEKYYLNASQMDNLDG
jgi:hypothetical protein